MRSSRHLATAVIVGLLAAAPLLATPASAADYTDHGTIRRSGTAVTESEFGLECPGTPPLTQGLDAWVFTLPPDVAAAGTTVTLTAPLTAPHDLGAHLYGSDCSYDRTVDGAASFDLAFTLANPDPFLVVYTTSGSNVEVTLTATPGG